MVYFPNLGVNRRGRLCGVASYASAQPLDFLELGKIATCVNWKHPKAPGLIKQIYGRALINTMRPV
jgi:hypothetical protein